MNESVAQDENRLGNAVPNSDDGLRTLHPLPLNSIESNSVIGIRRVEVSDNEPANTDVDLPAEPSEQLPFHRALIRTIQNFATYVLLPWAGRELHDHLVSGPFIRLSGTHPRPLHLPIDRGLGDAEDDANHGTHGQGNSENNEHDYQDDSHALILGAPKETAK